LFPPDPTTPPSLPDVPPLAGAAPPEPDPPPAAFVPPDPEASSFEPLLQPAARINANDQHDQSALL